MTIVGEPGVGKSRLCAELFGYIDERPELVTLAAGPLPALRGGDRLLGARGDRQGRVRHPRVGLARRGRGEARARAARPTTPTAPGSRRGWRRSWARRRSRPRRRSRSRPGGASWRRWPPTGPTVLVFEDLHWADDALLSFLEHLADWSQGVPLLVLCTARPELLRAASDLGSRAAQRDHDQPRPADRRGDRAADRARCSSGRCCRRRRSRRCSSGRAATRCTRRSSCACSPTASELGEAVEQVPDSVQALIAARLDTLSAGAQEPAPGRRRDGQGVLGGRAGRDGRSRPARGRAGAARAGAQGARPPARTTLDGRARPSTASGTCWSGTSATRRSRAPARAARHRAAAAWLERQGRRAGRGPGRRARPPLPDRARARPRRRPSRARRRSSRRARSATWPWPASARSRSTSTAPRQSLAKALALAPAGHPERALAARALGAGRAAAGPAPGGTGRARGGARPLPRAGRRASPPGAC